MNTRSCAVAPIGRLPGLTPTPAGLSATPLEIVACGWNGTLPPSSVESFSVTRLWNMPTLVRSTVLSFSW